MALKRFGVSLEEQLLVSLDRFVAENGFSSRSQALAFFIEKNVAEQKWLCNHEVAGAILLMFDPERREIAAKIEEILSDHRALVLSASTYYLNCEFVQQVIVVKGEAQQLTALSDSLVTIRGLKHGKLLMSRAD